MSVNLNIQKVEKCFQCQVTVNEKNREITDICKHVFCKPCFAAITYNQRCLCEQTDPLSDVQTQAVFGKILESAKR